jgi:hypothetical protein
VVVTTPVPGSDQVAMGMNPNSLVAKAQAKTQHPSKDDGKGKDGKQKQYAKCPICSAIAGNEQKHGVGSCYLDGTTPIPDFWKPRNQKILQHANKLRRERGQTPLTLWTPPAAAAAVTPEDPVTMVVPARRAKGRTAQVVQWEDTLVATMRDDDVVPFVGALEAETEPTLAGYAVSDPTFEIQNHVAFDKEARKFTCLATGQTCQIQRDPMFGMLLGVDCTLCKKSFSFVEIPRTWRTVALWTTDPLVLPAEAQAEYKPPPVNFDNQSQNASSAAAGASATRNLYDVEVVPTLEEVHQHLAGNGVFLNKPHSSLPINRLAWSLIVDEVRRTGGSPWESRIPDLLVGREPDWIADQMLRLDELKAEFREGGSRPSSPWASPPATRGEGSPAAVAASSPRVEPGHQADEDVDMRPADAVNVPPARLDKGKAPMRAEPTPMAVDPSGLADDLASLRVGAGPSGSSSPPKRGEDPAMADMRAAIEALQNTMSRQDEELRELRRAAADSAAAAQSAQRLATTATTLLKQCVSVQVADSFQEQLNAVVEVVNSFPDQLLQLEGRVNQTLNEGMANLGHHTSSTIHADAATKADVRAVELLLAAAQRDADQRFRDVDAHIENFLKFMMAPSGDYQGLEQRLQNTLRQAATPEEAERRLRYLEDQVAALIGFRQDSPNMGYVNEQIEYVKYTAGVALARADRAEEDIRLLRVQQLREEVAEQQEAHASLQERVNGLEQTSKDQGANTQTLSEKIAALYRAESRFIHDFNLTWEYLRPCLRVLFPTSIRLSPMFNTAVSPLVLHSTLFSLRRLADSSRHTPPAAGTSVLHKWLAQQSALGRPGNPAVPAGPAPAEQTTVPSAAPRSFAEVVRNPTGMPVASGPSPTSEGPTSATIPAASPARSILEQAAATALPDSSDSDRANDSGVPTPQVGSPARAGQHSGPARTSTATDTVVGPQLVHRTNVSAVQLKTTSSASVGQAVTPDGTKPSDPVASAPAVDSPCKAEAPLPASPKAAAKSTPSAPKTETGEGSGSPAAARAKVPDLPKIRVTAPASPAAATPSTPTTPASRKAKRELAKLASDWPSFQADTSLERKARRRSPTPVSPRSETEDQADPVGAVSIYGDDPDYDEEAEMAALDALLAPPTVTLEAASVSEAPTPASPSSAVADDSNVSAPEEGDSLQEGETEGVPLAAADPDQSSSSGSGAAAPAAPRWATSWPSVEPKLFPTNGRTTVGQHRGGEYAPSAANVALHKQYFSRRPLLVDLKQDDPLTSLQLFDQENTRSLLPQRVMIDSGARVFILISPSIAKALELTIDSGTAPIRGIGGSGGSLGATKEYINVRLGACTLGEVNDDPCTGCFTLKVKAIVMTEEAVKNIGHHVLLGQGFIRYCIGMADPLTERFYYSPAWWTQACQDFRVSVPCTMSTPEDAASVRNFLGVLDTADEDVAFVDQTIWSDTLKQPGTISYVPELAAPLAPGFPQTEQVSAEQYATFRQEQKERNEETRRVATEALAAAQAQAANELANIIEPTGVVFPLAKLKNSGRLLEGMRLDLSGASQTIMAQLSKLKESIIAEVMRAVTGSGGATAPTTAQAPAQTTAPAATQAPLVTSVMVDHRADLPYSVPVNWAAHGGGGLAPHNELVLTQPKSCLKASALPFQAKRAKSGRNVSFGTNSASTVAALAASVLPRAVSASGGEQSF